MRESGSGPLCERPQRLVVGWLAQRADPARAAGTSWSLDAAVHPSRRSVNCPEWQPCRVRSRHEGRTRLCGLLGSVGRRASHREHDDGVTRELRSMSPVRRGQRQDAMTSPKRAVCNVGTLDQQHHASRGPLRRWLSAAEEGLPLNGAQDLAGTPPREPRCSR